MSDSAHLRRLHDAKVAIDRVGDDTTVDMETVIGSLEELAQLVEEKLQACRDSA
jgi:hypothetical protein